MELNSLGLIIGLIAIGAIVTYLIIPISYQDTTIILKSNGNSNSTDSTECINVGSGTGVIKNSTSGNCFVKSIVGSGDISITNTSNTIIIDFNGTAGESTQCINIGSQTIIIKNSTSGNCYVKSITTTARGITVTNSSNTLIISTNFANGTGILITGSTTQTFKTNFVNGTGISITGSTSQTFINTGVISNSCSSPISCSGTNPSSISCSTCVTTSSYPLQWTLLNSTSPTDGATTWTINIASKKFLYVDLWIKGNNTSVTAGSWNLRFNGDTGSTYGYYQDLRGTVTQTSINGATSCNLFNADENWSYYQTWQGYNLNTENKIMSIRSDSYSTNAVSGGGYSTVDCAWSNTSNAITSITILRTSGTFTLDSSSTIWIYGHD